MAKHLKTGKRGEQLAVEYLERKGYQILDTNWRFSRAELDIVAKDGEILVFVEVKTRSYDYFGKPETAVTARKEHLIVDAASVYMETKGFEWEVRFDIISILLKSEQDIDIEHFEDAFIP